MRWRQERKKMKWKPDSGRGGGGGFAAIGRALVRLASSWLVGDDRQGRTVGG
jgi:hypothetical protein